jgi:uncharacterized protein YndB with AHSA1/START domain
VWGPPTYPATVVDHDLRPGGRTTYYMTSPEGEKFAGYWTITDVEEPEGFAFEDGFADLEFTPNPGPARVEQRLPVHPRTTAGRARRTSAPTHRRGAAAGARHGRGRGRDGAINQIDGLLAS